MAGRVCVGRGECEARVVVAVRVCRVCGRGEVGVWRREGLGDGSMQAVVSSAEKASAEKDGWRE